MELMLDCRRVTRLLSQSQDATQPLTLRAQLRLHLVTCPSCRHVDRQVRFLRTAVHSLQP